MRSLQRILSLGIVIMMVLALFGGCKSNVGKNSGNSESVTKPVALRFMWWGGDERHKATLAAIQLYEKNNPNVKIEGQYQGYDGYLDKLTTALAGGTAADIIQFDYLWRQTLASNPSFFLDFNKYSKYVDLSQFDLDFVRPYGSINNVLFGLPTGLGPMVLEFNKTSCTKAGVDTSYKWTWDDLLKEGAKVNKTDPNSYFLTGFEYESVLRPYVIQQTGQTFIKDDYTLGFSRDQLKSAFVFIRKLYDEKVFQPAAEGASYTDLLQNPKWLNGQIAANFEWASSIVPDFQAHPTDADAMMMPIPAGAKDSGIQCPISQLLTVSKQSKNIVPAVQFVNSFLNDPEMVKVLGTVRSIPASKTALDALQKANLVNPVVKKAVEDALSQPGLIYNTISDNSELAQIGADLLEEFRYGRLTPDQATDKFITLFTNKLAELKASA